jgi:hydroxyacylglutathione hydrolase
MIRIDALPAFTDNYLWLLQDAASQRCAVVDPGDAAPVLAWLAAHPGWQLSDILVTHHHFDHVGGIEGLKAATGARVLGPADENIPGRDLGLSDNDSIEVLGLKFRVIAVPGHTLGHIAYYQAEQHLLFCGDTLFAAGCGRLFEGTPAQMHASLGKFMRLPDCTRVYCTHEYTLSNIRFARAADPANSALIDWEARAKAMREVDVPTVPTTIGLERATNPFVRCNEPGVIATASQRAGKPLADAVSVLAAIREWKNGF